MPHIAGPNHTQIPNIILESMDALGNAELRVVLAVCRKTFGWQKRQDRLSLTQLQNLTGLSRQGTIDGIEDAIRNEWIIREPYGQSFVYSVNLVDQSTSQANRPELVKPVDQLDEKLVKPVDTQKKEYKEKKETTGARKERAPRQVVSDEESALIAKFVELTHIPAPTPKTGKDYAAAQELWYKPLRAIIAMANGSSARVLEKAIAHSRQQNWNIACPKSLAKSAAHVWGENAERWGGARKANSNPYAALEDMLNGKDN